MKTTQTIIAYIAAVVLRFAEGNDTSDSRNRGTFYPLTTDTASPEGSETKRAFKRVLSGFYSLPYTDILATVKRALRGFCEAVAGIFSNRSGDILQL